MSPPMRKRRKFICRGAKLVPPIFSATSMVPKQKAVMRMYRTLLWECMGDHLGEFVLYTLDPLEGIVKAGTIEIPI